MAEPSEADRERARCILRDELDYFNSTEDDDPGGAVDIIAAALAEARASADGKWIATGSEVIAGCNPPRTGSYLCLVQYGNRHEVEVRDFVSGRGFVVDVTHWRELPAPPDSP